MPDESELEQHHTIDLADPFEINLQLEKVKNEIYTRLDNARRTGVDITKQSGKTASPFRAEDEAPQNKIQFLVDQAKSIEIEARKRTTIPKKSREIQFYEFKKGNVTVKMPVDQDPDSLKQVGGDISIEYIDEKDRKTTVTLVHPGQEGASLIDLTVDFPTVDDYEGLQYFSTNDLNQINGEEYTILSEAISTAFAETFDFK